MKQKEIVPKDSAYNKLYPFPPSLSKKSAVVALVTILLIFIITTLISITGS